MLETNKDIPLFFQTTTPPSYTSRDDDDDDDDDPKSCFKSPKNRVCYSI